MPRFNHAFTIAFEVESATENGNLTAKELLDALTNRVAALRADYLKKQQLSIPDTTDEDSVYEIVEACGKPFDSYPISREEELAVSAPGHM